ncbi:Mu-like prophage I protein [Marinibacterium anthonyi]|nr:Mu-like prophage I protein [Marinibacterium anthonyi]
MSLNRETGNALLLADIELASADGKPESWVQLLPAGRFDLTDKRGPWVVKDVAAVIARSRGDLERGMPVDMDHALERHREAEAPAAGWIEELAARDDGVWGRIAWTPTGKAKIEGREYRFISPVVMVTKAGEVMSIKRAGLTNDPAIAMKAICSTEDETPEGDVAQDKADVIAMLREALGASPDTPVADLIRRAQAILAAADSTRTDNASAKALASSYMTLLSELHEDRVEAALERARSTGKLVPAMEGWAQELASSNLASFEAWEATALPLVNLGPPRLAGKTPPATLERGRFRGSSERTAICSQLGIDPEAMDGTE